MLQHLGSVHRKELSSINHRSVREFCSSWAGGCSCPHSFAHFMDPLKNFHNNRGQGQGTVIMSGCITESSRTGSYFNLAMASISGVAWGVQGSCKLQKNQLLEWQLSQFPGNGGTKIVNATFLRSLEGRADRADLGSSGLQDFSNGF